MVASSPSPRSVGESSVNQERGEGRKHRWGGLSGLVEQTLLRRSDRLIHDDFPDGRGAADSSVANFAS